jgi:hypothetical protein
VRTPKVYLPVSESQVGRECRSEIHQRAVPVVDVMTGTNRSLLVQEQRRRCGVNGVRLARRCDTVAERDVRTVARAIGPRTCPHCNQESSRNRAIGTDALHAGDGVDPPFRSLLCACAAGQRRTSLHRLVVEASATTPRHTSYDE